MLQLEGIIGYFCIEIIHVYFKNYMEHINTFCAQNVGSLNVKRDDTYSYHCAQKC